MTNRIPEYLRLHLEDAEESTTVVSLPEFDRLGGALAELAGLQLTVEATSGSFDQLGFPRHDVQDPEYRVRLRSTGKPTATPTPDKIESVATALSGLVNSLQRTRSALCKREAELAAAVPVVSVESDTQHLSERLQAVLRGSAESLRCQSAGLYVLDEATTSLKLRSHHGLPENAVLAPPRELEAAAADIEALSGHAVVIEDTTQQRHWTVPQPCRSAICVPISSPTTILGTLWFFCEQGRDFSPAEQHLAEMTAGRLASDLERFVLIQEIRRFKSRPATEPKILETPEVVPTDPPQIESWQTGLAATRADKPTGITRWFSHSESRFDFSVSSAPADPRLGTICTAHMQHDSTVRQAVHCINATLWTESVSPTPTALLHASLDPRCGTLEYMICGGVYAYVLRPHAWESLLPDTTLLGCETINPTTHKQILMPGDILLTVTGSTPKRNFSEENVMNHLAEKLLRHTHLSAADLAQFAAQSLQRQTSSDCGHRVFIARRSESR